MKSKVLKESGNFLRLQVEGIDTPIANALRRIMIAEIETLAVDTIDFYSNTGALPNEFVAHRIGLLPIMNVSEGNKDRNRETMRSGELFLTVNIKNDTQGVLEVLSGDLEGEVELLHQNILITKLNPTQELHCKCFLRYGKGMEHIKWSPVCLSTFTQKGDVFTFEIESIGVLHPMEIFKQSISILTQKLEDTLELIE